MAGILANSASVTMLAGDTAASKDQSGYVATEQITLSVVPAGTTYAWAQSTPEGSVPAKSALSDPAAASPRFRPDATGIYCLTCTVDGATVYAIRCAVVALVAPTFVSVLHLLPVQDASVPVPSVGKHLYDSATGGLSAKLPDGSVKRVTVT